MSTKLEINNISKYFGEGDRKVIALNSVSFKVQEGELFTLLGPSGCGKTTMLRLIAGLETPTSGTILFDGIDYTSLPPFRRNIGMVFQSYALYPHMNVFENVAYGLRVRRYSRKKINDRVNEALRMVNLSETLHRKPAELSGGQQQRIALARALVYDPKILLLDEPLSNLDAKLRVYMREEIRKIQRESKITAIYVTHDQEEALCISDRIAVMNAGEIIQIGTPDEIYEKPNSVFVADFVGKANLLDGTILRIDRDFCEFRLLNNVIVRAKVDPGMSVQSGARGVLFIRPTRLSLSTAREGMSTLQGEVRNILYLGNTVRYSIYIGGYSCDIAVDEEKLIRNLGIGDKTALNFHYEDCSIFIKGD